MICSTCDTEVDEYYRGKQCKACFRIPQKRWHRNNTEKDNAWSKAYREKNPAQCRQAVRNWRKDNRVYYLIHSKLKTRCHVKNLTDVYIRRQVRRSVGPIHTITDQEIDERRQQIIRWRRKRQLRQVKKEYIPREAMIICSLVEREIPVQTCDNMQIHYEKCQGCEHQINRMAAN